MAGQPAVQPPVEAEPRLAGVAAEPSLPESSQPEVGQPEPDQSDPSPTLSKKQLKKQARRQHTEEAWVVKKKHQKEVRKEAKRTVRDSKQAAWEAMTEEDREDVRKEAVLERSVREASRAAEAAVDAAAGPTPICVIDLDFDELMDEQEVRSLVQQLMYSYGANKRARRPLRLHLTSLGGRIETQLHHIDGTERWSVTKHAGSYLEAFPPEQLVYLSSDSAVLLTSLEPGTAYIIGGLVDHNRHKGLTQARAVAAGVRTARLPIDEHMQCMQRRVLAVNHVFEILLHYTQHADWGAAVARAMPQRRGATRREALAQGAAAPAAGAEAAHAAPEPEVSGGAEGAQETQGVQRAAASCEAASSGATSRSQS